MVKAQREKPLPVMYFNWIKCLVACLYAFCILCLLGMWFYNSYATSKEVWLLCVQKSCSVCTGYYLNTIMSLGRYICSPDSLYFQLIEYLVTCSLISCHIFWRTHSLKFTFPLYHWLKKIMSRLKLYQSGKMLGSNLMFRCWNQAWNPLTGFGSSVSLLLAYQK